LIFSSGLPVGSAIKSDGKTGIADAKSPSTSIPAGREKRGAQEAERADQKHKRVAAAANCRDAKQLFVVAVQTVVITFDALSLHLQEGLELRIPDDFSHAVVNRPDRPADAAFGDPFIEAV
jgi:hypothetical protein